MYKVVLDIDEFVKDVAVESSDIGNKAVRDLINNIGSAIYAYLVLKGTLIDGDTGEVIDKGKTIDAFYESFTKASQMILNTIDYEQ